MSNPIKGMTHKHLTDIEKKLAISSGESGVGKNKIGIEVSEVQTSLYKIYYKECSQYFITNINGV